MANSGRKTRAVIDTNVFISAHLSNQGASYEIIRKWREESSFHIISSEQILAEVTEVLLRKGISDERIEDFVAALETIGIVVEGTFVVLKLKKILLTTCF